MGNLDYEDRAWSGQVTLAYRAPSGFTLDTAFDMDLRNAIRGAMRVPRSVPVFQNNARVRIDVG